MASLVSLGPGVLFVNCAAIDAVPATSDALITVGTLDVKPVVSDAFDKEENGVAADFLVDVVAESV